MTTFAECESFQFQTRIIFENSKILFSFRAAMTKKFSGKIFIADFCQNLKISLSTRILHLEKKIVFF